MITRLKNKLRLLARKAKAFFKDPPLDVVGGGVIANLAGRTGLYGAFTVSFAAIGQPVYATLFIVVMALDIITHIEVLAALRRLMIHDVQQELSKHHFMIVQPLH